MGILPEVFEPRTDEDILQLMRAKSFRQHLTPFKSYGEHGISLVGSLPLRCIGMEISSNASNANLHDTITDQFSRVLSGSRQRAFVLLARKHSTKHVLQKRHPFPIERGVREIHITDSQFRGTQELHRTMKFKMRFQTSFTRRCHQSAQRCTSQSGKLDS